LITALAGGVGAAKFLRGLAQATNESISVIVNTGDDIVLHGLHISPDIDIVTYALAGISDRAKGWGIGGDTFNCLRALRRLGCEDWFMLGDQDFATHIYRTRLLSEGLKLSEATSKITHALGIAEHIIPMTDDKFETKVDTDVGLMHFQEYLVKRGSTDKVVGIRFDGAEKAKPAPGVIESILDSRVIIVCPSNPIVSIGTILSIQGLKTALKNTKARVIGISPIIGGAPVKGPADKLMAGLGIEVSAYGVATTYQDFLDIFIIDRIDSFLAKKIESLGMKVVVTNTLMTRIEDAKNLAQTALIS
jgi:LPPG:FO 2-phospho-L-lactate transferase